MKTAASVLAILLAQAVATPRFDVVSIKKRATDDGKHTSDWRDGGPEAANGGRDVVMTNGTIGAAVLYAYPVQANDIDRAPAWLRTDRYDIRARSSDVTTREQRRDLVRAMLADRFKLQAHYATAQRPVYRLVLVKAGQLGTGLKRVDNCAAIRAAQAPVDPTNPVRPCAFFTGGSSIRSTGAALSSLASYISRDAGRLVLDATGLQGDFAYQLDWNQRPDDGQDPRPPLPQALEDTLGMKLQAARAPVQVLVIDHIERPTSD